MEFSNRTFLAFLLIPLVAYCDVFTAMVDIENMLKNEAEATTAILTRYVKLFHSKL
jgi:hypothetical protein